MKNFITKRLHKLLLCFIQILEYFSVPCTFFDGDLGGGYYGGVQTKVGVTSSESDCAETVRQRDPSALGAVWKVTEPHHCWKQTKLGAAVNANANDFHSSTTYRSCLFRGKFSSRIGYGILIH